MPWPIIGHEWAVALLRQSLAVGRVSHAYLFCGQPQIGKATLARTLAQALNCAASDAPCGKCPSCAKIANGTHPDVQIVAGKGAGGSIQIDQIRALQREAALAPYSGRYRVAILRQMDRASLEAANSVLKTLEEPPPHVVLLLTASRREGLPSTVTSRCQCLDLRPVPFTTVKAALLERGLDAAQSDLVAHLSGGRAGWAIAACQDDSLLRQRRQDLDQLVGMLSLDRVSRLDLAWKLSRDAATARRLIELWTTWWRDLLLAFAAREGDWVNVDRALHLKSVAAKVTLANVWTGLKALRVTAEQLEENVNPRLALESLFLQLPYLTTREAHATSSGSQV
jgi:DNA polymerase-3 subunit delta'